MEAIWTLADKMGVRVVTDPEWHYEDGAYYQDVNGTGIILMPAIIPIRLERWLIGHELGHHCNPIYRDPSWLAEAKANKWAIKTLLGMYDHEEVDWPQGVMTTVWEALAA